MDADYIRHDAILIDGTWQAARDGATIDVTDPSTGKKFGEVAAGGAADIDAAVASARQSFEDRRWRGLSNDERSRILWKVGELMEARLGDLAAEEARNAGQLIGLAQAVAGMSAESFRYNAGWCTRIAGANMDISKWGMTLSHSTQRQPLGVAGLIVPWNAPLGMAAAKIAPALAAGCSVVLKPAEETPVTAIMLGEILLEAGVPAGVVNIVPGIGSVAGSALSKHADVNKISFTGSTSVGKQLIADAAGNLKRLTLELGGKSPFIILRDADLSVAIPAAAGAIFTHSGQVCTAGSRLLVDRAIYDEVLAGIGEIAASLKLGSPFDAATQMGPLVSARQRDSVLARIERATSEGGRVFRGGGRFGDGGYFVQPTIIVDAAPTSSIVREEVFGPVVTVGAFDTIEDAVAQANDSIYGLAAYLWGRDIGQVNRVTNQLEAGTVWVNCSQIIDYAAPFGGFKQSGWGREYGRDGVDGYLETKSVISAI